MTSSYDNANLIIYLAIMVHGTIYGDYDAAYNYSPMILDIPPEFNYVNKITKNVRGSIGLGFFDPETGENKLWSSILNELSNLITIENTEHTTPPITGQPLLNKMTNLHVVSVDHYLSKTYDVSQFYPQPEKIYDKYQPLYSSIDTTTTSQYINKVYSKDTNSIKDSEMDIFVLYQENGPLHTGDTLLETIYNTHHSRLRRSSNGIIAITLNDLFVFLSNKGYKNVVLIDFSCETCRDQLERTLPTNTTHVRRARRALKNVMGGRGRNRRRKQYRSFRRCKKH